MKPIPRPLSFVKSNSLTVTEFWLNDPLAQRWVPLAYQSAEYSPLLGPFSASGSVSRGATRDSMESSADRIAEFQFVKLNPGLKAPVLLIPEKTAMKIGRASCRE